MGGPDSIPGERTGRGERRNADGHKKKACGPCWQDPFALERRRSSACMILRRLRARQARRVSSLGQKISSLGHRGRNGDLQQEFGRRAPLGRVLRRRAAEAAAELPAELRRLLIAQLDGHFLDGQAAPEELHGIIHLLPPQPFAGRTVQFDAKAPRQRAALQTQLARQPRGVVIDASREFGELLEGNGLGPAREPDFFGEYRIRLHLS